MWHVDLIYTDAENIKQEGIRISAIGQEGVILDIPVECLQEYRGLLINADVTMYGVRKKRGEIDIPRRPYTRYTGKPISTYTLFHADTVVLKGYEKENKVEILAPQYIPFALRGDALNYGAFIQWIITRVNNLQRTYMNAVYIARQVGRDYNAILRDSCAISVVDQFWVKRHDVNITWSELNRKRDINEELVKVALTGKVVSPEIFKESSKDTTSLFTIKGAFPKALLKGYLLKQGGNAEYEAVASILGNFLGISVAEATIRESDSIVFCKLFTSTKESMAHAQEFMSLAGIKSVDHVHEGVYMYFGKLGRVDILRQLERLYIFQYLVENADFHDENFGFKYDPITFKVLSVAPAFDFNSAFMGFLDPTQYYSWIISKLPLFVQQHPDIIARLKSSEFINVVTKLSLVEKAQFDSILGRAAYLCNLN